VERCRQPGCQLFDLGDDPELVRHGTSRATPVLTSTIAWLAEVLNSGLPSTGFKPDL
jgi:hypothetical protein